MTEKEVGLVFQYFSKANVAAVRITSGTLKVGDRVHVLGHSRSVYRLSVSKSNRLFSI